MFIITKRAGELYSYAAKTHSTWDKPSFSEEFAGKGGSFTYVAMCFVADISLGTSMSKPVW